MTTKTVYTAITYDHDRNPLEDFLRAANYNPVPIEVGDMDFFVRAVNDNPHGIAVVSSLVNSKGLDIGKAWEIVAELHAGVYVNTERFQDAGFTDIDEGHYGDRLASAVSQLSIPSLTIIFSSEYPRIQDDKVKFVLKRGWSGQRDACYQEISGHLDTFFKGTSPT